LSVVGALLAILVTAVVSAAAADPPPAPNAVAGEARGLVQPHGAGRGGGKRAPNMTYHGGPIMTTAVSTAIFWGPSWTNSALVGDKVTGLDSFYAGFSRSNYSATSDEYTGSNGPVGVATSHRGHVFDSSAASGGANTTTILNEVIKEVTANNIPVDSSGNSYFPVYTDLPRGNAGYCAWHSTGSVNGTRVEFAFFWKLDGDSGCDPGDTTTGHSEGLAALANVSAHELSEARTDPASPGAWHDGSGAENGDKCAWTSGSQPAKFSDGSTWKVQGEWSNAAYTAGTGYPNSSGQRGCLGG
jgi:hypothetical protein